MFLIYNLMSHSTSFFLCASITFYFLHELFDLFFLRYWFFGLSNKISFYIDDIPCLNNLTWIKLFFYYHIKFYNKRMC